MPVHFKCHSQDLSFLHTALLNIHPGFVNSTSRNGYLKVRHCMYLSGLAVEPFLSNDHIMAQIQHVVWLELVVPWLPARAKMPTLSFCLSFPSWWANGLTWNCKLSLIWLTKDLGMGYRLELQVHVTVLPCNFRFWTVDWNWGNTCLADTLGSSVCRALCNPCNVHHEYHYSSSQGYALKVTYHDLGTIILEGWYIKNPADSLPKACQVKYVVVFYYLGGSSERAILPLMHVGTASF